MIDVLCLREKTPKRETRLVNLLLYIQKTLWKVHMHIEYVTCIAMNIHSRMIEWEVSVFSDYYLTWHYIY